LALFIFFLYLDIINVGLDITSHCFPFDHCIACSSSTCVFYLSVWHIETFLAEHHVFNSYSGPNENNKHCIYFFFAKLAL